MDCKDIVQEVSSPAALGQDVAAIIRSVPNFPRPGFVFRDISPLMLQPDVMNNILDYFCKVCQGRTIDLVVGLESRGWLFGPALAMKLSCGFVMMRKAGKLPPPTFSATYDQAYAKGNSFEFPVGILPPAPAGRKLRCIYVDDFMSTGGSIEGALTVMNHFDVESVLALTIAEYPEFKGRAKLAAHNVGVTSIVRFPDSTRVDGVTWDHKDDSL